MTKCEVCGNTEIVGVASSSIIAASFPYCNECLLVNAEPYDIIVGLFIGTNVSEIGLEAELEKYESWAQKIVYNSLRRVGKSTEEFLTDVELADAEFMALMEMEDFETVEATDEEIEEVQMMFDDGTSLNIQNEEN